MKSIVNHIHNDKGTVMVTAILILAILTGTGIVALFVSNVGLDIAKNDQLYNIAFFSAESARGYVASHAELYGSENDEPGNGLYFPNKNDQSQRYVISNMQEFNGYVEYLEAGNVPRGSGYAVGKFRAHRYRMLCNGFAPFRATSRIEEGFYRIGL